MKSEYAAFLEKIIKEIVGQPDAVGVEENSGVLEIKADESDLGIIIGKSGKNIRSLRNLVNLKSMKAGQTKLELKINDGH